MKQPRLLLIPQALTWALIVSVLAVSSVPQLLWSKAMKSFERIEPMTTMLRRYDEIERTTSPVYRKPDPKHVRSVQPDAIAAVADIVAQWDNSNPFARARTAHYIKQGYIDGQELGLKTNIRLTQRRRDAKLTVSKVTLADGSIHV